MSFYNYLIEKRNDSEELKEVMERLSNDLSQRITNDIKPGILLGLIQSGKTRAFIGVIAKCFDLNYDVAVVMTKNSVALAEQTIKRLKSEFEMPIERNRLYVWDIIKLQSFDMLTGYILRNKVIFVVKKEAKNLEKLMELFQQITLRNKRVLIIDDEADQASVSFVNDRNAADGVDFATIATAVSDFRNTLTGNNSYLQVTATPYSLYLQPEDATLNQIEYAPLRPAFTYLLKPHGAYIGGKYYFEDSLIPNSVASFIHTQVPDHELTTLNSKPRVARSYNGNTLNNILNTTQFNTFRKAICNFLVGGAIRQLQEQSEDVWAKPYHCAFVMHTSTTKAIQAMQKGLIETLIEKLQELLPDELRNILTWSYQNMSNSVASAGTTLPSFEEVFNAINDALQQNHLGVVEVNSDNQVAELLGDDGQLRLDNPFNIFVGGQSLDRGITIDHLIGFFYGRNPGTFQMDTVLQHSRMYGSRSIEDLAVTRFYTSARVYEAMRQMHWFDKDLRENIERDIHTATARFIAKQGSTIIPAGPNKLRASNLMSFRAFSRLLPIGFQTRSLTDTRSNILHIDNIIARYKTDTDDFVMPFDEVKEIINLIRETFVYEPRFENVGLEWDTMPFLKAIEYALEKNNTNNVFIYQKIDRNASRYKNQGASFGDAPEDGRTDSPICRSLANNGPVLMLLKQNGVSDPEGWRDAPFYWPVLILPANMPNYIYCEN